MTKIFIPNTTSEGDDLYHPPFNGNKEEFHSMRKAFEQQYGQSWSDRECRLERAVWSAAWQAAKAQ